MTHDNGRHIGVRLREIRQLRRLSLTELARRVGVSKSMLSQVEKGTSNPSLTLLRALSSELGVSMPGFFAEDNPHNSVVRRAERQEIRIPGSDVVRELVVPDIRRQIIVWTATILPGQISSSEPVSHRVEECVLVLSGSIEVQIGSSTLVLNTGDSYYIDSSVPHVFTNKGDVPAEYLTASIGGAGRTNG